MIRGPGGVGYEIEIEESDDTGFDPMFTDGWWDTGIGCDDCRGLLYDNGKVYKCNECGREYSRL